MCSKILPEHAFDVDVVGVGVGVGVDVVGVGVGVVSVDDVVGVGVGLCLSLEVEILDSIGSESALRSKNDGHSVFRRNAELTLHCSKKEFKSWGLYSWVSIVGSLLPAH